MKNTLMKLTAVAAAVAGMSLGSVSTHAATADGVIGNTSTGTVDLQVIRGTVARISGLATLDWGNVTAGAMLADALGANGDTREDPVCVFSTTGNYQVTPTSALGGGQFRMTDGVNFLPYTVNWDEVPTTGGLTALGYGVASATFSSAAVADDTCGGGNTARLNVNIDETVFNGAGINDGIYADTLTLVVAPVP